MVLSSTGTRSLARAEAPSITAEAGAVVPRHRHEGLETILVLHGTQSDETGDYGAGTYIVNAAGTEHSVWSDTGCVVLIQWDRPVTIF